MSESHQDKTTEVARLRATAKLPSGRSIEMRELTGTDEINAAAEAGDIDGAEARVRSNFCLIRRSVVSIDGAPVDQGVPGDVFRDRFNRKDWAAIQELFEKIHTPTEDELGSFRSSIRLSA